MEDSKLDKEHNDLLIGGMARACPLPVEEDPDMQDYSSDGDVLVIEARNEQ